MQKSKLILLKTITPMHVGASEGCGFVDMPIQREASTNIPKIESYAVKGALREYSKNIIDEISINNLFGIGNKAGELAFTDLRLLFFPVNSSNNIFSLITCPYVLERYFEDAFFYGINKIINLTEIKRKLNKLKSKIAYTICESPEYIYLEGCFLKTEKINLKQEFYYNRKWLKNIINRVVIISNKDFVDFTTYYTEVVTRNKINKDTGTTKESSLFTQEYVPSEAIFYGIVSTFENNIFNNAEKKVENNKEIIKNFYRKFSRKNELSKFQIGASSTLGKGIVELIN